MPAVASGASAPPWTKPRKTRKAEPSAHSASGTASPRSSSRSMWPPRSDQTITATAPSSAKKEKASPSTRSPK